MKWNPEKSVKLSVIVTWIALWFALFTVPLLIVLRDLFHVPAVGALLSILYFYMDQAIVPLLICLVSGAFALGILLLLLRDIGRGEVFTLTNVNRLRAISWCGFVIMAVCAVAAFFVSVRPTFILLAAVAGFVALLVRVIKNVIDAARLLKEDSDYTI